MAVQDTNSPSRAPSAGEWCDHRFAPGARARRHARREGIPADAGRGGSAPTCAPPVPVTCCMHASCHTRPAPPACRGSVVVPVLVLLLLLLLLRLVLLVLLLLLLLAVVEALDRRRSGARARRVGGGGALLGLVIPLVLPRLRQVAPPARQLLHQLLLRHPRRRAVLLHARPLLRRVEDVPRRRALLLGRVALRSAFPLATPLPLLVPAVPVDGVTNAEGLVD
mmetsp:Transcript_20228/g.66253  ORF Transcript_20228/g.66253 Transcript_20228/m.66253 type:complete len:223 (+) Transcript_20228:592-1260(+)